MLSACTEPLPLKIGFIGGLTGRFADLGTSGRNGAILAAEHQNAQGGVRGRPVTLLIRDDEHDPLHARQVFGSLLKEEVQAFVGPMTSAIAVELAPLATQARIVLMGATVSTDLLTGKDDYFLRPVSPPARYATQTAQVHLRRFGSADTVVIYDLANRDYAEGWAKSYEREVLRQGGRRLRLFEFDSREEQASGRVAGLAMQHLQTLGGRGRALMVLVCSARDAGAIARAVRAEGLPVDLAGSTWPATEQFIVEAGHAAEGALFEQIHDRNSTSPAFVGFREAYRRRFGREPDYSSVVAFDALQAVLQALGRNPNPTQLKQSLLTGPPFSGLQGEIRLDAFGDGSAKAHYAVVQEARYVSAEP